MSSRLEVPCKKLKLFGACPKDAIDNVTSRNQIAWCRLMVLNYHQGSFFLKQMENITEICNWSKCMKQLIMGSPAPIYIFTIQPSHWGSEDIMKSGWEDHKSQRNKKLAMKLCLLYITGTYSYEILTSSLPTQNKTSWHAIWMAEISQSSMPRWRAMGN